MNFGGEMNTMTRSQIKDSGDRTQFETGAVRDMQGEDKGRCDLLPLDIVGYLMGEDTDVARILEGIQLFIDDSDVFWLRGVLKRFADYQNTTLPQLMLEVSIHYREGSRKYPINNWKLGIPISSFVSSGVRHFLKHIDNQKDERHDRAFVWNMLGAMWTMEHKPEMDDITRKKVEVVDETQEN